MITLPAMSEAQTEAWHALFDLHDRLSDGWTLIGGQMVHIHCAERGSSLDRSTSDADTVLKPLVVFRLFVAVSRFWLKSLADGAPSDGRTSLVHSS